MNLAVLWLSLNFLSKLCVSSYISVCLLCRNAKTAVSFYLSDCSLYLCTMRTCLILERIVRSLPWPNAAAQWGHAWSLRFTCPLSVGVFESKVLGGDRVWVVEWIVRTCVPR